MKIGLVRRGYSPTGGAEAYLGRFAAAARAAGHDCVLFASDDWPQVAWTGDRVPVSGRSPRAFADALEAVQPRNRCDFVLSLERVWKCDAYRAGDGVHAAWLARRARYEPFWKRLFRRFNGKHAALLELERALFRDRGAGQIVANSQLVKREIVQYFAYPEGQIEVVPNGVPSVALAPETRETRRVELGLDASAYVLLFAGSGWERKGLRFAIEALHAAALPQAILLVAGRGKVRSMPRSPQVRYLGPMGEISRLLAASDVFILPTIYDPFSNACLEALSGGLPVITTAANGFGEIIESGLEGEVVSEPMDIPALAGAIKHWAEPARRLAIRPRLLAKGARFSIEENVRRTLAIIEKGAQSRAPV